MARMIADENVRLALVLALRALGHDVLTALEAGRANQGISDADVLAHATLLGRAVLTYNHRHFRRLHKTAPNHSGIISCTDDPDCPALAQRIHDAINPLPTLAGRYIRIVRPS
jgi:hypothetical protein